MAFISTLLYDDLAALKALPATSLVDGMFYGAKDADGSGTPAWYLFKAGDATPVDEPLIADPTNATGRLIAMGLGAPGGGGGLTLVPAITADPGPAVVGNLYPLNSSGGAFSVTLPAAPADGALIGFFDWGFNASLPLDHSLAINNVTINPGGGDTIMQDSSLILDLDNALVKLQYVDSANRWVQVP